MSIGLILFTLADSTLQPEFNHTGKLWLRDISHNATCFYKSVSARQLVIWVITSQIKDEPSVYDPGGGTPL